MKMEDDFSLSISFFMTRMATKVEMNVDSCDAFHVLFHVGILFT